MNKIYLSRDYFVVLSIVLPAIYLADQRLNLLGGNGVYGSLIYIAMAVLIFIYKRSLVMGSRNGFFLMLFILGYSVGVALLNDECGIGFKSAASLGLLLLTGLTMRALPLHVILMRLSVVKALLIVISILNILKYLNIYYVPIFNEPSHFGLYVLPLIAYILLLSSKSFIGWLALFIGLASNFSTTLFVGVLMLLFLLYLSAAYQSHSFSIIKIVSFFTTLLILSLAGVLRFDDTASRIDGVINSSGITSANDSNLSSLVWLNGWSQAYQTLISTNGLGLGFNQMGCGRFYNIGNFSSLIQDSFDGDMLNSEDGSLLSSKLISEFGILGVVIVTVLVLISLGACKKFIIHKRHGEFAAFNVVALKATGAVSVLILLFIRSPGPYFSLQIILTYSLLFFSSHHVSIKSKKI